MNFVDGRIPGNHWKAIVVMSVISMLLFLAGDVETNPGPRENSGENDNLHVIWNLYTERAIHAW